jgi:hypothetical protein
MNMDMPINTNSLVITPQTFTLIRLLPQAHCDRL